MTKHGRLACYDFQHLLRASHLDFGLFYDYDKKIYERQKHMPRDEAFWIFFRNAR